MMGTGHAASGLFGAAITLPIAAQTGANPIVWTLAWVGGAMLPDLDTSGSHAARVWGAPTRVLGGLVGKAAGGHREATHDIVLAPAAVALAGTAVLAAARTAGGVGEGIGETTRAVGDRIVANPPRTLEATAVTAWGVVRDVFTSVHPVAWAAVILVALIIAIAARITIGRIVPPIRNPAVNLAFSFATSTYLLSVPEGIWWAPFVVAAGVIVHIVGDSLTNEGAPLPVVWIWDPAAKRIEWGARAFKTGSALDRFIGVALLLGAGVLFVR